VEVAAGREGGVNTIVFIPSFGRGKVPPTRGRHRYFWFADVAMRLNGTEERGLKLGTAGVKR